MDLSLKIDTVEGIDCQTFLNTYFYKQKPVIIKGLLKGTIADEKWCMEYIKEKLGHVEVDVYDNSVKKTTAYTHGDLKMHFSDFIDTITQDKPTGYRLFLFDGFKHCNDLRKEFPCPELFKGILGKIGFMFFGGKSTNVRMHFDIDMSNVMHTQFVGRKRVFLFSPDNNDLLYKTPMNTYSIADFDNPDYEKFPGLKYAKGYDIILEHGDTLFMPSGYWHYMMYQDGSFGVAYRKMAHNLKHKFLGISNLTYKLWIDKLMSAVFKKYWTDFKSRIAFKRANNAIEKLEMDHLYRLTDERNAGVKEGHGSMGHAA